MRVLLVEDTEDVAGAVCESFARRGDAVDHAATIAGATDCIAVQSYDVVILDIGLPDGSGKDLLQTIRASGQATPVLVLSARSQIEERVSLLDEGADDYMVKPFDLRELHARVRALARRQVADRAPVIEFGDLRFDPAGQDLMIDGVRVQLTRRELSLLEVMLSSRGRVISKERIHECMFSFNEDDVGMNAVEICMTRLRRKLEGSRVRIKTLRGLGYQMVADV